MARKPPAPQRQEEMDMSMTPAEQIRMMHERKRRVPQRPSRRPGKKGK